MRSFILTFSFLMILHGCALATSPESEKLALEAPLADVHFHGDDKHPPERFKELMDRNNVQWAGGVGIRGRTAPDSYVAYAELLGERYIVALGQPDLTQIFLADGAKILENGTDHPLFRALLDRAEGELSSGRAKGFGELFVSNRNTTGFPAFRRKTRADSPTMQALYLLAAQYGAYLQMHLEFDRETTEQLRALLSLDERGKIILSHCGSTASAEQIRRLMDELPNVYCELSYRGVPPLNPQHPYFNKLKVYDERGLDRKWRELIEAHPDRFMIGTDAYAADYDQTIRAIRRGLLANLKPDTLRKVAYENAIRVLGLTH